MKKILAIIGLVSLIGVSFPQISFAAGISASGGGTKTVGQSFSVSVVASGAEFNAFQGSISTTGPVSVTSVSAGSANWMTQPSVNGSFAGATMGQKVTSFTIATIKLKATGTGSGAVTVSGVTLKNVQTTVGSSGGSASFTIQKAPELPGAVKVSSTSHPDQATAYEATTIALSWEKESGVDTFSYLLDQVADTTPAAKATDANVSASYPDKPIGTYYFHIRAHKTDGWGTTTHFKINIKEPDAKIDTTLSAPSGIIIKKASTFENDIKTGMVSGIIISGKTEPGFLATVALTPVVTVPEGKKLSVLADNQGNFELLIDYPIASGFHKINVQGALLKVLTPISDDITFEISQAKGGTINLLTEQDAVAKSVKPIATDKATLSRQTMIYLGIGLLAIIVAVIAVIMYTKRRKNKKLLRSMSK